MSSQRRRAIIFDLDGVLWNSTPHHARAYRGALRQWGILRFDYHSISGTGTKAAMKKLLEAAGLPARPSDVDAIAAEKSRRSSLLLTRHPPILKSTVPLLRRLAKKHPLGLASSASAKTVGIFLKASGTKRLFKAVVSANDVKRAKPFPDLYRRALKIMGARPMEAIVVEDAVSGVRAARAARVPVVGISGQESRAELKRAGAIHVFSSLREVERYVDGL